MNRSLLTAKPNRGMTTIDILTLVVLVCPVKLLGLGIFPAFSSSVPPGETSFLVGERGFSLAKIPEKR